MSESEIWIWTGLMWFLYAYIAYKRDSHWFWAILTATVIHFLMATKGG